MFQGYVGVFLDYDKQEPPTICGTDGLCWDHHGYL